MVILVAACAYFAYHDRHDSIILLFIIILIMGDSRQGWMVFSKALRGEMLIIITVLTIYDLWVGRYRISKLYLALIPFLMVSFLALSFSPFLNVGFSKTISFSLLYFCILHYFVNKFSRYGLRMLGDITYFCHAILALGLFLLPILPGVVSYGGARYNGMMGNPNGMGMFVTMVSPMTIYFFRYQRGISKRYKIFAWSLIVISLMLCSSRNAIFSFSLFMMVYFGLNGGTFRRLAFLMVALPLMTLLVFFLDIEAMVVSLGLEKYFRLRDFESGSGRIFAWQHAIELIQERPWLGCGFACEEYNFLYRTTFKLWSTGHQGGVHNSYLAFLVNTGGIGLTLFMGFLANIFIQARNRFFVLAFIASAGFSAMFESWMFSSLSTFHILFLIMTTQLLADRYLPVERLQS